MSGAGGGICKLLCSGRQLCVVLALLSPAASTACPHNSASFQLSWEPAADRSDSSFGRHAVVLKAVLDDPLLMAGGLLTVSEMGRMLTHHGDDQEEEDDEDDDDDLHGDSDGGDMALDQLEHALNADDFNLHPVDFDNFGMGIHVGPLGMPVHALQGGQMDGSDTDDDMEDYPVIYE